ELGSSLTVSTDGDLLVLSSWLDNDVRVWDPVSKTVVERHSQLGEPTNAIRFDGGLVICEHANHRVISIKNETMTVLADGLDEPTGLAAKDGTLYVADRGRGQLLEIVTNGVQQSPPKVIAEGLKSPEGIAVVSDRIVVVEAATGRVLLVGGDGAK